MIKYSLSLYILFVLISHSSLSQRLLPGYTLTNSDTDSVFGEFRRPQSKGATQPLFDQLFISGQMFDYVRVDDSQQLLQRLSGEAIRLYRSIDLSNPTYFIQDHKTLSKLTTERINVELGKHFTSCNRLSNAMAYTKVKYKTKALIQLIDQYAACIEVPNPTWSRKDSTELNLSFDYFGGVSKVQDQLFKDHSGAFSNIDFQGWGLTATAFSNRRIRMIAGIKFAEMHTINPMANVAPLSDPNFSAEVEYRWNNYEIPIAVAYNFQLRNWRAYTGLVGSVTITENLTVSELFSAPFLTAPEEVRSQLIVNSQFGFGGVIGLERKLGLRWILGLQFELQRSQMDFNMARFNRNLEQQPPVITTYRISTPELFASATDLTKLRFTTSRISISLKFRAFWNYSTFN